jgi:hypothetical protein
MMVAREEAMYPRMKAVGRLRLRASTPVGRVADTVSGIAWA